ncbi:MAG: acyl-CoA dehydrogenase family protein [Candidatus Binatia bacterium]
MDLKLTDEQKLIVRTAREFLAQECPIPTIREWEQLPERYSKPLWAKIAEMGWTGAVFPEEYGGLGFTNLDVTLLMKEMGRVALPGPFLSTVLLSGRAILEGGSAAQKEKFLPQIAAGTLLVAFAFVEGTALPNAQTVKTTARLDGGAWVLSGTKWFVEFAEQSDVLLVVARTQAGADLRQGLTLFLVERDAPGVRYVPQTTLAEQPQARVILENVRVAPEHVVGPVHQAWPIVDSVVQSATAILCGYMTGLAERANELGVDYSNTRVQFGKPIGAFQAVQGYLATAWAKNLMGEYMGYYAAWLIDEGLPSRAAVSAAKAFVGYSAVYATQIATQLHGGLGATVDARTTPFVRWAKQLQQTLGNSQYHEKIVAEEMLDKDPIPMDELYSLPF